MYFLILLLIEYLFIVYLQSSLVDLLFSLIFFQFYALFFIQLNFAYNNLVITYLLKGVILLVQSCIYEISQGTIFFTSTWF